MRREKKKELTRSLILESAAELFSKRGYNATSVDDIVHSADVVKGTFYYHFRSKEELVLELRRQALVRDMAGVHTALAAGASPLRVLVELFAKDAAWTEQNTDMAQVFFTQLFGGFLQSEASTGGSDTPSLTPPLIMIIDAAQKRGELRSDVNPVDMVEMLMGVFGHAQFTWLLGSRETSLVERTRMWIELVVQGLAGEKSVAKSS